MEHVVFYTAPDGSPAFRRVPSLEQAVGLVEHLRNVEGVHQVAVHPLGDEVPLAFRTWYRVEVPAAAAAPAPVEAPAVEAPVVEAPVVEAAADDVPEAAGEPVEPVVEVPAQDAPEPVGADAPPRGGLSSLGFFAT